MGNTSGSRRKRPLGVTLMAILQITSGLQLLLVAVIAFIIASSSQMREELFPSVSEQLRNDLAVIFLVIGVVALAIALFSLILARGYMRGREWARRRGRKIAFLAILLAVFSLVLMPTRADPGAPIWTILLNLFLVAYLGRRRVRQFFR